MMWIPYLLTLLTRNHFQRIIAQNDYAVLVSADTETMQGSRGLFHGRSIISSPS